MQQGEYHCHCQVVKSCQVFWRKIREFLPDIILLNIHLLDTDNYSFCREIKTNQLTKEIPVIFLSPSINDFDKEKGFSNGGDDYLIEPFCPQEVIIKLKTQIKLKKSIRQVTINVEQQLRELKEEIRQYRQLERNLSATTQKYKTILATTGEGFWMVDILNQGKILEVNDAYCQMTGYDQQELLKMTIFDLEVIETPEETEKRIEKIIRQGSDQFESIHRCKNGNQIHFEINVTYLQDLNCCVGFFRDISERKAYETSFEKIRQSLETELSQKNLELAEVNRHLKRQLGERQRIETALRENELRYRYLYDHTPVMLHSLNQEGKIISVSDYWLGILGYRREEVINQPLGQFFTLESRHYLKPLNFPFF